MIDNPLPASPLSGGGASPSVISPMTRAAQFPPLTRGGLGWGCPKALTYALSHNLSPTLNAQYQLQLPDKKLLQAKLHELLTQEWEGER
jgi:hypothetical protein